MRLINFYIGAIAFYDNGGVVLAFGLKNSPAWKVYCLKTGRGE